MPIENPLSTLTADQLKSFGSYFRNYQPGVGDLVTPVDPGFLLGSIIWPKSLGKPLTSDISHGFSIWLKFSQSVFDFTPPAHFIELPVVLPVSGKYDATRAEDEDYHVGFVMSGLSSDEGSSHRTTYALEVSLHTDVEWTSEVPFIRRFISPRVRTFQKGPTTVWLEPFRVLKRSGVEVIPGVLS